MRLICKGVGNISDKYAENLIEICAKPSGAPRCILFGISVSDAFHHLRVLSGLDAICSLQFDRLAPCKSRAILWRIWPVVFRREQKLHPCLGHLRQKRESTQLSLPGRVSNGQIVCYVVVACYITEK